MKRRIGIGLAAALLVTCPTTWATEAQSIEIKVEDIASLKKYPKVALIGYAIEQQNFLVKMSTSWGSTSSSTSEVTLEGVSTPAMQAATDRLYADLVKRLEAAGLEVVKLDEVRNDPKQACTLAKSSFAEAIAHIEQIDEENYKDSTTIMQLIRDNLTLWTTELEHAEDNNDD